VFPPAEVGGLDVEPDDVVVIVDHMCRGSSDRGKRFGLLAGKASQCELIIARAGKGVQDAAQVPAHVAPLRRLVRDGNEYLPGSQDRRDGVQARAAIGSDGGQIYEPVLLSQPAPSAGQTGRPLLQLPPRDHNQGYDPKARRLICDLCPV
jgi:hypothetical protein